MHPSAAMTKEAAQAGVGAGEGKAKSKRVVRSKAVRDAEAAAKKAAKAAKAEERARAKVVKAKQKELKRQEKEREKLEKGLFSFKRMLDMIRFIEEHLPKGGPTKHKWELVANDMNSSASPELQGRYTPENVYQKHLSWSKKVDPTGNPQYGDQEELDLMQRYKAAEQKMVAASRPDEALEEEEEEAELRSEDHKCAHCGNKDGKDISGHPTFKYIPAGIAPVRREEGVDKFKEDAFLNVPYLQGSSPVFIEALNKFIEAKAQRKVRIYCLECMAGATAKEGAALAAAPVAVDAGRRGVRDRYSSACLPPAHAQSISRCTHSHCIPFLPSHPRSPWRARLTRARASALLLLERRAQGSWHWCLRL